jgi:hypothetical protein
VPGYHAIRFDEPEDVPWKPGLSLRPVRSQLGLKAFGAGAVLAFGGPPTFEPAGHEYMTRVRGAIDRPDAAMAIAREPDLRREAESGAPLLS